MKINWIYSIRLILYNFCKEDSMKLFADIKTELLMEVEKQNGKQKKEHGRNIEGSNGIGSS